MYSQTLHGILTHLSTSAFYERYQTFPDDATVREITFLKLLHVLMTIAFIFLSSSLFFFIPLARCESHLRR